MTSRAISASDRKQQIVEAAMRAFAAKNYDAASVADIAEQAGITKRAIYRYFPSKRDLFYEVRNQVYMAVVKSLWQEMPEAVNIADMADKLMRAHVGFCIEHPEMASIIVNTISESATKEFQENIELLLGSRADEIEVLLRIGIEDGSVDPDLEPRFITWIIILLFLILVYLHVAEENSVIPRGEEAARIVMHPFLESLAPRRKV
jgi:AcrR family transcriptional regulator